MYCRKLLENGQLVQELNLEAKVGEDDSLATFKTGLQVGFVILLVILIILGKRIEKGKRDLKKINQLNKYILK